MLAKLGKNIGYNLECIFSVKTDSDFIEKQKSAWEFCKKRIDQNFPCYGWELDIAEYYVIYGYDDEGYYFSGAGCDSGKGPKLWRELGDSNISILELYSVRPGTSVDDTVAVKEAIEFALEHASNPAKWIYPKYRAGLSGFDNWIRAMETGTASAEGVAYNAACWAECRGFGVEFLREAKERVNRNIGTLFDEAAGHYETVYRNLHKVTEIFPFPVKANVTEDAGLYSTVIKHLGNAKKAEEAGLASLEKIVRAI